MNNITILFMTLGAGFLIGIIFYGGLLWTVQKGIQSLHPAFWFLSSFGIRIAIVLIGFYRITGGDWKQLLVCMAGFLMARIAITYAMQRAFRAH